jgi:amino acid transporter
MVVGLLFVVLYLLTTLGAPSIRIKKDLDPLWKSRAVKETAGAVGGAVVVAIIWQKLGA